MSENRISVAMAVYEGEKYIKEQLDSILPQLGMQDELVISYDTSKDRTWEIIREYAGKDARIRVVVNDKKGVTGNFNNAIRYCRGDFIFLSDQDDIWAPDKVEKVKKKLENGADWVLHNAVHFNERGQRTKSSFFEMYKIGGIFTDIWKPRKSGCCMAFNRKIRRRILPIPEIRCYDQWISAVASLWGKCEYMEDILVDHRLHGNNVTFQTRRPMAIVIPMRIKLVWELLKRACRIMVLKK